MDIIQHENSNLHRKLLIARKPIPHVGEDEVLIRVYATSVTSFDLVRRFYTSTIQGLNQLLGMECSGIITQVGSNVTRFRVGENVCALLMGGGYAEFVAVDSRRVLTIPEGISVVDAASLPYDACFVWYSLVMRGELGPKSTIMIHGGCDEYGPLAITLAKKMDCTVFTTIRDEKETNFCKELGADHCLKYHLDHETLANFLLKNTSGTGVDFVFDATGKGVSHYIEILAKRGTLVFSGGDISKTEDLDIESIGFKQLKVIAVYFNSLNPATKDEVIQNVESEFWPLLYGLDVHDRIFGVYKFGNASRAYQAIFQRRTKGKKILLTPMSHLASTEQIDPPSPTYMFWLSIIAFVVIFVIFRVY